MANLGVFEINTGGKYKKLSDLTGITFNINQQYLMQNKGGNCILIESQTLPTEGGFTVNNNPFIYECDGTDVYIKTIGNVYLNISE